MIQDEKRRLENELTVMGLPGLDDPALVQVMADIVNGYPMPGERVGFFCELLNECEGARRREMYEAMRPRLFFAVPSLAACEDMIAAKAERMIRPRGMPAPLKEEPFETRAVDMVCDACAKTERFEGLTTATARLEAHKAGWGRGLEAGTVFCASCRLETMRVKVYGESFTKRMHG